MRRSFLLATLLGACAGAAALWSCTNNTNLAILPITVVDIPVGDLLSGANLGCGGAGPYDVYKYAAIITLVDEDAGTSTDEGDASCRANAAGSISVGLSDCFATHVFSNLPDTPNGDPLPDGGSAIYTVKVFFYNLATYCSIEGSDPVCASVKHPEDLLSAALNIEAGANAETLCELPATWVATCTATEQGNITVNTSCFKIVQGTDPPDAGSEDATTDAKADADIKDGAEEGPADADLDAPVDAPLDGGVDAGATDAPPG